MHLTNWFSRIHHYYYYHYIIIKIAFSKILELNSILQMLTMFNCTVKPLILLTLTVHLLFAKQLLIQAEDDEYIEHVSCLL